MLFACFLGKEEHLEAWHEMCRRHSSDIGLSCECRDLILSTNDRLAITSFRHIHQKTLKICDNNEDAAIEAAAEDARFAPYSTLALRVCVKKDNGAIHGDVPPTAPDQLYFGEDRR